ncbi:MAG: disulfide oxidoreductase [Planctomycetes bacterium]|nr:disulfide oxidoreductase [Planctomycetota bacterium]
MTAGTTHTGGPGGFTRGMRIREALEVHDGAASVFREFRMPCDRCVVVDVDTIESGAALTGVDLDALLARLNTLPREKP